MLHFLAIYHIIRKRISYVDAVSDTKKPPPKKPRKSKLYHLFFYAIILIKFKFKYNINNFVYVYYKK